MKMKRRAEQLEQEPERPERREPRAVPAAEEERHGERRERDHVDVLGHREEAEAHAAVLGVVAGDELLLGLGQVERRARRLGGAGEDEDERSRRTAGRRTSIVSSCFGDDVVERQRLAP